MLDLLDIEVFICCKCKGKFNHTEGTWLPIAIEGKRLMRKLSVKNRSKVLSLDHRQPEIITGNEFTCYDCLT